MEAGLRADETGATERDGAAGTSTEAHCGSSDDAMQAHADDGHGPFTNGSGSNYRVADGTGSSRGPVLIVVRDDRAAHTIKALLAHGPRLLLEANLLKWIGRRRRSQVGSASYW